jgi:drug/metabolite transporter (DMT)-like permease
MKTDTIVKWALFTVLCFIWGSSFILMKEGMKGLSPYQVASLRILSAGLVLSPLLAKALRETPKRLVWPIVLSGFLGTFFPAYLFCLAETVLASSLAGVLNSTTPLFTIIIGSLFFKQQNSWTKWLGVFIGFIGMILPMLTQMGTVDFSYYLFYFMVLTATIMYGLNANVVHQYLQEASPTNVATIAFSSLVIPTAIILGITGFFNAADFNNTVWLKATGASILLGIGGTCIASVIFYMLMKKAGPVFASTVTYGIPFVAIFWGILAGESFTAIQLAGLVVILIGVRVVNK